jgi:hypothetical protein
MPQLYTFDSPNTSDVVTTTYTNDIANPKLRSIAIAAQLKSSQSLIKSYLFEIAAWLVIPIGIVIAPLIIILILILLPPLWMNPVYGYVLQGVALCIIASVFFRLRRRARRYRLNALSDLRKDKRDPVLYLRSFYSDDEESFERFSKRTDEEILSSTLRKIGPVITIGRPDEMGQNKEDSMSGEDLPLLGAIRIFFTDKDWQTKVAELMSISQLLVINAGTSEGLLWEIKAAVNSAGPLKILISLLPWQSLDRNTRKRRYNYFRERAEKAINDALPNGNLKLPEEVDDAVFIGFSSNWTAELIKTSRWKRFFYSLSLPTLLREAIRPVLKERGIKLKSSFFNGLSRSLLIYGMISPIIWLASTFYFLWEIYLLIHPKTLGVFISVFALFLNTLSFFVMVIVYGFLIITRAISFMGKRRKDYITLNIDS